MSRLPRIPVPCAVALALLSLGGAPASGAAQTTPRDRLLASADWVAQHLRDPDLVILHVGAADDYAREHIPGAVFVDLRAGMSAPSLPGGEGLVLEMPDSALLQATLRAMGIGDRGPIVVYWGSEWVTPTARALYTLLWGGLGDRTVLLDGGLGAWTMAGGDVTAEVPTPTPGTVVVRPQPARLVAADWVQAHAGAAGYRVLDARAAAFYDGVRDDRGKTGHIPGAGSLPWTSLVDEQLYLKSAAELRALFDAAGVMPGDTVIAYCHIGQYATAVLFAARTLGHEVVLYDGAFQDWAARGLPVEGSN